MYHVVNWDHHTFSWRGLMGTPASVSYFFVSSGFLLTYTYSARFDRDELQYGKFWLGRCARLLPVYFLGLLVRLPVLLHTHRAAAGKMFLTVFCCKLGSPAVPSIGMLLPGLSLTSLFAISAYLFY